MLCDRCNENEAVIHIKKTLNGKSTEIHLCDQCAKETKENEIHIPVSFQDFLVGIMDLAVKEIIEEEKENIKTKIIRCDKCGMTYEDFKKSGKFGCMECYTTFEKKLPIVFKKLHGHTKHNGKVPVKLGKKILQEEDISVLKNELRKAILKEEFEMAAELRDRIKQMQKGENHE